MPSTPDRALELTIDLGLGAVVLVAMLLVLLHRRRRSAELSLGRGQRVVALQQQWLDPVVTLFLVGGVLRRDITDPLHLALAGVGVLIGAAAGVTRARLIFLEARPAISRIVLKRGVAEIAIVAVLAVIALACRSISPDGHAPLNLIATVVLTIGVAESVARTGYLTWRYFHEAARLRSDPTPSVPDTADAGR